MHILERTSPNNSPASTPPTPTYLNMNLAAKKVEKMAMLNLQPFEREALVSGVDEKESDRSNQQTQTSMANLADDAS